MESDNWSEMKEYFSRLFLTENATYEEVKTAYRKLAKKFHPDKNLEGNEFEEEFKLVQEAYQKLSSYFQNNSKSDQRSQSGNPGTKSDSSNNTHYESHSSQNGYQQNSRQEKQKTSSGNDNNAKRKLIKCRNCNKAFWISSNDEPFANCPYCNGVNSTGWMPFGSKFKIAGCQAYICSGCKNEFHADVYTYERVLCPFCYSECILPKSPKGFKSIQKGTYGFVCAGCKGVFFANRKKYDMVICPHCKELINLPKITYYEGLISRAPNTHSFICGTCQGVFYVDRRRTDEAICPHCRFGNTLPDNIKQNLSVDPVTAIILIILGIMFFTFFFHKNSIFWGD